MKHAAHLLKSYSSINRGNCARNVTISLHLPRVTYGNHVVSVCICGTVQYVEGIQEPFQYIVQCKVDERNLFWLFSARGNIIRQLYSTIRLLYGYSVSFKHQNLKIFTLQATSLGSGFESSSSPVQEQRYRKPLQLLLGWISLLYLKINCKHIKLYRGLSET